MAEALEQIVNGRQDYEDGNEEDVGGGGDDPSISITGGTPRPNSLVIQPDKEPLNFNINLVGAPPDVLHLIEHIKSVAEQFLFHWKTFPIVLPECKSMNITTVNRKHRQLNLQDLFIKPQFDELEAVAADGNGEVKYLTQTQLKAVRERGEFDVSSINFPGQIHKWQLSAFLQKGTERTHKTLHYDLALAARFFIVSARNWIFGDTISIKLGLQSIWRGFLKIVDIIVGIPSLITHNLSGKILEERSRFLIAELMCRSEYLDTLDSLCAYIREQYRRAYTEKFKVKCKDGQQIPYLFLTPKGQEIDLRLFSRELMKKALPILKGILERETRGWFLHFRERLIAELREKKLSDAEIEEEVNEAVMKEYLQRIYSAILNNSELVDLGEHIPELLIQQAQSVVIMHKALGKVDRELRHFRDAHTKHLLTEHPILSKIDSWLNDRILKTDQTNMQKVLWDAHDEAIRMCHKQNLQQSAYFLGRDLTFMKEREPVMTKELKNVKNPTRSFQWPYRVYSPKSWIVRRNFHGQSEIIPTVICQQATSIITPRSDPSQPVFLVERETIYTTTTRWPLWRVLNFFQRTWCWTWNIIYLLGIMVPWESSFGIQALISVKPFMPDLELSQVNGTLFPRKTSITQTMASRLLNLWRSISKSRTQYESEPETGFVGKDFGRHFNRIWNYFFKGFLGTLFIVFIFPLMCLLITSLSVLGALTAPIWIPLITLGVHIFCVFGYDIDSPRTDKYPYAVFFIALLWDVLIVGVLQISVASLLAALCPIASGLVFLVAVSRYWLRLFYDSLIFHTIIKKYGRIPTSDGFLAKRIVGPGLKDNYYFKIRPEQALASLDIHMEMDELNAYQQQMERLILQPQKDYSQFVEACFGPFSATIAKTGCYKMLERESKDLLNLLHEKLEKRRMEYSTLAGNVKSKVKLNTMDLKISIQQGAQLLERFYPSHVFNRLPISEDEFWDSKGLQTGDWSGLASLIYTDVFSLDFLTPLCDSDIQFNLESHPKVDLYNYTEMVQNVSDIMGMNGPDLLENVYVPRGNIKVNAPYLDVSAFNPRWRLPITDGVTTRSQKDQSRTMNLRKLWIDHNKQITRSLHSREKLLIPLPIPHPVEIAVAIYNRDTEQPLPLGTDICSMIFRAMEDGETGGITNMNLEMYRGTGCNQDSDSTNSMSSISNECNSLVSEGSLGTRESVAAAGGTETLPCGVKEFFPTTVTAELEDVKEKEKPTGGTGFHWTLGNWTSTNQAARRRNTTGTTVRVDLASPEDISLDTDSTRVVFTNVGTNV